MPQSLKKYFNFSTFYWFLTDVENRRRLFLNFRIPSLKETEPKVWKLTTTLFATFNNAKFSAYSDFIRSKNTGTATGM